MNSGKIINSERSWSLLDNTWWKKQEVSFCSTDEEEGGNKDLPSVAAGYLTCSLYEER